MLIKNLTNKKLEITPEKNEIKSADNHYPSSVREWSNSIYVYNKNTLNYIPYAENLAMKIIKSFFSIYNKNLNKITRTRKMLKRLRKYSSHKIFVSKGEFKHTNNKVVINLYIFNRQKTNYISFMKNWYTYYLKRKLSLNLMNRMKYINSEGLLMLNKVNSNKLYIFKALNKINSDASILNKYKTFSEYINNFYKILLNKSIRKYKLYFYYKQLLFVNKNILNYNFLHYLQKYLELIYNKNIEFNIVNLKRFYLNSDILSESITMKITRNRRKLLRYLNTLKGKVKIHRKRNYLGKNINKKEINKKYNINNESLVLENIVLNNLKYKHVTGFRLQSTGRLTRRYTASRSISKIKYKGNLLDIDSSYRGLSTVLLKGNLKSNLQFTKLRSKTRIGSFGIKGWVSGN